MPKPGVGSSDRQRAMAASFPGHVVDRGLPAVPLQGCNSSQHALCIWLPTFELRLEFVRSPELDTTSVALLSPTEGTRRTVDQLSESASVSGVEPGMLVSQAVSLCPSITLLEPDPAFYDAAATEMLEVLSGLSPIIEPAGRGRVFVGADGLERLHGSAFQQVHHAFSLLLEIFPAAMVAATRVGWALGRFGAWVAAGAARPGKPVVVPETTLTAFLRGQPISTLPVSDAMVDRLRRLDIDTLGELTRFPEASLIRQFGADGKRALGWASGTRIDPIFAQHCPEPIRAALDMPSPIGQLQLLHTALDRILDRALSRPARRGRSVQAVRLTASLEGGGSWSTTLTLREPTAERAQLSFTLRSRIALSPPSRAVEQLTVEFFRFGPASFQGSLLDRREDGSRAHCGRDLALGIVPEALRGAVHELRLRLGHSPLFRVVEVDPWSRIPERRHALLPFEP